jgi:hypothetical protein
VVLLVQRALDLLAQDVLVEEVLDADADAVDLVCVGGSDPVVPIWRFPRKRSVTLSSVRWYWVITWALALTSRRDTSTPRAMRASSSSNSTSMSMTTPLEMTGMTPSLRMPDGSRWRAYFSPSMTTVWPALFPPLNFTT